MMPKTPKTPSDAAIGTCPSVPKDTSENCEETKRKYYYDDAYGYEVYDPAKEDDDEEKS